MPDCLLVENPATITAVLDRQDHLGVDTEFMRERTFFAELCLVQVATGDQIYCVDPLATQELHDFWRCLCECTWILHSARQDIEVVFQAARMLPQTIFDTQIAAGLLGYKPQIGYANLVRELFAVDIPKSHTRADWKKRPLSDALLNYAAEDVQYLLPLYEALAPRLDAQGRLTWAEEDSLQLLNPALYEVDPALAIDRLKGAKNLRGRHRAAAARLAAWREAEALRVNRPRQWIARDAVVISLAQELPDTIRALRAIDGLAPKLIRRSGNSILEMIAASGDDRNDYVPPVTANGKQKSLLKNMQELVTRSADELGIASEILASRRDLSAIIIGGDRSSRLLRGWRREVIGGRILELL